MKHCIYVLLLFIFPVTSFSQVPIYFHVNSHNEEGGNDPNYSDSTIYTSYRELCRKMADTIAAHSGKWNFQTDWKFVIGALKYDHGTPSTNSKNLLKWLYEDKGFEVDAHHHTGSTISNYNYADVAHLIDSLGFPCSKNVGGFEWLDTTWQVYERGLRGTTFLSQVWYPNVIWGGGTPSHTNDLNTYGAWKPKNSTSITNFYINDTTKRVTLIGNGCSTVIADTSNLTPVYNTIVYAINYAQAHPGKFYSANIMFNIRNLNTTVITKIGQILTMLQPYFASGKLVWKTLTEKYNTYNTLYHNSQNTVLCDEIPVTEIIGNVTIIPNEIKLYQNYPNPFNPVTKINYDIKNPGNVSLKIFDVMGREVVSLVNEYQTTGSYSAEFNSGELNLSSGTYYYALETGDFKEVKKMVLVK
ncbi:MAG: T9SS type A sorting domain-containing protein [Bacteroidetes bacterium]|nr:T9SS type A sorting domain-containing protein [Bacteroidota bacterium]